MESTNRLQIRFKPSVETFNKITNLLGVNSLDTSKSPRSNIPSTWVYEVVDGYDFINEFLDILENKYEALAKLDIERSGITIWHLYEYDQQCNMEFDAERLKRLGDNGITLCISCWEKGSTISFV